MMSPIFCLLSQLSKRDFKAAKNNSWCPNTSGIWKKISSTNVGSIKVHNSGRFSGRRYFYKAKKNFFLYSPTSSYYCTRAYVNDQLQIFHVRRFCVVYLFDNMSSRILKKSFSANEFVHAESRIWCNKNKKKRVLIRPNRGRFKKWSISGRVIPGHKRAMVYKVNIKVKGHRG